MRAPANPSPRPILRKAGDGNRTRVNSLEGYRTTIVLHPLVVARAGFEPAISGLKGRRPLRRHHEDVSYPLDTWEGRRFAPVAEMSRPGDAALAGFIR